MLKYEIMLICWYVATTILPSFDTLGVLKSPDRKILFERGCPTERLPITNM